MKIVIPKVNAEHAQRQKAWQEADAATMEWVHAQAQGKPAAGQKALKDAAKAKADAAEAKGPRPKATRQ